MTEKKGKETLTRNPGCKEQGYPILSTCGLELIHVFTDSTTYQINTNLFTAVYKELCQERWFSSWILEIPPRSYSNTVHCLGCGNFLFTVPLHQQGQESQQHIITLPVS